MFLACSVQELLYMSQIRQAVGFFILAITVIIGIFKAGFWVGTESVC